MWRLRGCLGLVGVGWWERFSSEVVWCWVVKVVGVGVLRKVGGGCLWLRWVRGLEWRGCLWLLLI